MANAIERVIKYLQEPEAQERIFKSVSYTAELEKDAEKVRGTNKVKYQRISFANNTLGTFNRVTGYTNKDISMDYIDRELTQDMGDSLYIDKMDDEEALANGIVKVYNKYTRRVVTPAVDKYRFSQIFTNAGKTVASTGLAANNVAEKILDAFEHFVENGIDTNGLILYVSPQVDNWLRKDMYNKGHVSLGVWNGDVATEVRMFDTAKIKPVPSTILGAKIKFALVHPDAVDAFVKYSEAEFFDKIPGHGKRRAQVDAGVYHDCWLVPETEDAVYVMADLSTGE